MALYEYKCALPAPIVSVDADNLFALDIKPITRALNRLENALSDPEVKPHVLDIKIERKEYNASFRLMITIVVDDDRAHYILEQACLD